MTLCNVTAMDSMWSSNAATNEGGGAAMYDSSKLMVTNCGFHMNTATNGAGVYAQNMCEAHAMDTLWTSNAAVTQGGGSALFDNSKLMVTDCGFHMNTATDGAGVYAEDMCE
eukprot:2870403-Rhodomonas_salina.1